MIENLRGVLAVVALLAGSPAHAGFCPSGADLLQYVGPGAYTLVCSDATGADGCWEPPSGACQFSNTVTVSVDGSVISTETYNGTGDPNLCTQSYPLIGHYFTAGPAHTVLETTSAPPSSDSFTVTVLAGPACDADGDDILDTEDNCLGLSNPDQMDTDLDGEGDACDKDDDGDTCLDDEDDDSAEGQVVIGSRLAINCPDPVIPVYGWAGDDVDNDGLPACLDPDDDDDGVLDGDDQCPATYGDSRGLACLYRPVSCPLQVWWDVCMFGGCNELLVRWMSVINPPNEVLFEDMDIVGQSLVLSPTREMSLEAMRRTLLAEPGALEVWTRGRDGGLGELVAKIGEYDPRGVEAREGVGNALVLGFDERGALVSVQQMSH